MTLAIACFVFGVFPDFDQFSNDKKVKLVYHRNIVTHSIVPWVLVWVFNPFTIFVLINGVVGVHLLMDLRWSRKKQTGFYTIKYYKKGMSGKASTAWLAVNGLLGIGFTIVWGFL